MNFGRTVHVVPGEDGAWNVVDLRRHGSTFPSQDQALRYARRIAKDNQPSQVVMFDAFGRVQPVAHYQLPSYELPQAQNHGESQPFEAALKALLIAGFAAAGITVLGELVDRVESEAKQESAKSHRRTTSKSRNRRG